MQCARLNHGFSSNTYPQSDITPAASVLNLGVLFDENNFKQHVKNMSLSYFYHICDLCRICQFMSLFVAKTIATALVVVSSRFHYCNCLLYNTANKDIVKLQRVQICLARIVTRSPHFSRSVPLLKSLHWLSVHYGITYIFKICTIAYQALSSVHNQHII